jgi:hypothetical protein
MLQMTIAAIEKAPYAVNSASDDPRIKRIKPNIAGAVENNNL